MRKFPLAAVLIALLLPASANAQTAIKLGIAQASIGTLPLLVAQNEGLLAAEGIDVESFEFRGGAPAVQALASGSIDVCVCASDHAVRLRSRGLPAKIIAGLTETHGYALLALSNTPVTDLAEMRGRTIGITTPGGLTDNSLRYSFEQLGLNPDRDVTLASIGTGLAMKAAVDSGAVDAGMFTTPDVQAALTEIGKYKIVHDYRNTRYAALDLIVLERWLGINGDAARGFLRAVIGAQNLIRTNPVALRAALRQMYPHFTGPLLDQLVVEVPALLAVGGRVSEGGFDTMIAMLRTSEPDLTDVPFAEVVTAEYLPAD